MQRLTFLLIPVCLFTGCVVGPIYRRPTVQVPKGFRAPEPLPPEQAASLADLKWFEGLQRRETPGPGAHRVAAQLRFARCHCASGGGSRGPGITRADHIPGL